MARILAEHLKIWTAGEGILVVTAVVTVATASGVNSVAPALGAAIGASLGCMMPISTPPNAIVYSSGHVPAAEMMKSGILLDLTGAAVVAALLRILLPICGLW